MNGKAAVFFLWLLAPVLQAEGLSENQARFGKVSGDVRLLSSGAADWIEAHEGLPLEPGDHIRTGEDGEAEIVLSENALWMMNPRTDLVAERMEVNAGRFHLTLGALLGKVNSTPALGGQRWEFDTPQAVCAVRGTEFALDVSKEEGTRLGVVEGEVEMSAAEDVGGLPAPVRVGAGREGIVQRGRPLKIMERFSPRMQAHIGRMNDLRARQGSIQRTWSPFTAEYRKDLRRRKVAPPPKRPAPRPPAPRHPRQRSRR